MGGIIPWLCNCCPQQYLSTFSKTHFIRMNSMKLQEKERLKEEKRRTKKLVKERKLVSNLKNAGLAATSL